jgi:hypothetical protein
MLKMFLISIDPHVKKSSVAFFVCGKLENCITVDTQKLIGAPGMALSFTFPLELSDAEKHLIIERPWVGKNPKGSISLAITVGKIMGSLIRSGFEVYEAPAWGNDGSWISDMLSVGRRMPTRAQVAELSMQIAKSQYPSFKIDEHSAAAICIGMWFLKKRKLRIGEPNGIHCGKLF